MQWELFSAIYYRRWKYTELHPQISTMAGLGFLKGLIGIAGWHSFLTLHPNLSEFNSLKYFLLLLLVHEIFGFLIGLVFKKVGLYMKYAPKYKDTEALHKQIPALPCFE